MVNVTSIGWYPRGLSSNVVAIGTRTCFASDGTKKEACAPDQRWKLPSAPRCHGRSPVAIAATASEFNERATRTERAGETANE